MDGKHDMLQEASRKLTYEDLLLLPDDGLRHELIDGVHYVTASPVTRHQRILRRLAVAVLIDPGRNSVEVFRKKGQSYVRAAVLTDSGVLTTPLFPQLQLRLSELFR